jgi:uncharacterized integral membrane protein
MDNDQFTKEEKIAKWREIIYQAIGKRHYYPKKRRPRRKKVEIVEKRKCSWKILLILFIFFLLFLLFVVKHGLSKI